MKSKSLLKLQEYISKGYLTEVTEIRNNRKENESKQKDLWLSEEINHSPTANIPSQGVDLDQFLLTCMTKESYQDLRKLSLNAVLTSSIIGFILDRLDEQDDQFSYEISKFEIIAAELILRGLSLRESFILLTLEHPWILDRSINLRKKYREEYPRLDEDISSYWSLEDNKWKELMLLIGPS